MQALTKVEPLQIDVCDNIQRTKELARKLMETKHYAKIGEEGIFAICMYAESNGIPKLEALNGELYYIQGKVGVSAECMNKHIRKQGHSVSVKVLDDKGCTLVGKRKDTGDVAEVSFTYEDMKRAGKNYEKNLLDMYFARALSRLKRILFPDILTKVYEKGETEDIVRQEAEDLNVKQLYTVEAEDQKKDPITIQQAIELNQILQECSDSVKTRFNEFLKNSLSVNCVEDMPAEKYATVKKGLVKERNSYQKELAEKEMTINQEKDNAM
jgi:hypothetical protein